MLTDQRTVVELLYKVSREFASALDLKLVLQRVLFSALNNVGGERGSVVVMDDSGSAIDSAIVYGNQLRESTTLQLKDTVERGLAGWVVRQRQAALVPDTSLDARWLRREDDLQDHSGAKSAICVPLLSREKLVGVLTLVHPTPGAYAQEHLELMQAIADQAGITILNARLYAESQRQARVMTALAEGAASMNSSLRLEEVFERILLQTRQALTVESAALGLLDSSGALIFHAASGPGAELLRGQKLTENSGIAGQVMREGRGLVIPQIGAETTLAAAEKALGGLRAIACAPILAQGKVIGVLEAFNPSEKIFDPDALLVLNGLGGLAGTVIQNAQLFEQLDTTRRRYHDLFEDSIDPIVITDLHGRVQEANQQAAAFSGYSALELRQLLIEQIHDLNFEKVGHNFEKIGAAAFSYESILLTRQGAKHPVQVYLRKVMFDNSPAIQWILRDISERKELDALREDLAAMIYHDLRSPLSNILSSVEMLKNYISPAEQEEAAAIFRIAHNSIDRIQRLVTSLLDINRLEQNHPIGERQLTALSALLQDVLQAVLPGAEGRGQNLEIALEPNLPALNIDADMIRRVLINLAENAIKYTPSGGRIEIGAKRSGEAIRFWVLDDGPGIPESERERVFDKFTRLKSKGGPGGMGVGLAFCKLAVQGHGGKIWVEAAPKKGSQFIFTLPIS
ncbi:MAG: hypothetical protein OHK0031_04350 [Anaerolineales bacterium]